MAPATFAGAPTQVRTGRGGWDRDSIIKAIREWVALHGEPPRAADWNPSSAKWAGQTWRIERYRAGRPDGSPWPALNSAKRPFGGSLTAAIEAAGFRPAKPGPKRRTEVRLEQADRADMGADGRALLDAALAQARAADRRVAALEDQLVRARDRASRLAAERDAARRAGRASRPALDVAGVSRPGSGSGRCSAPGWPARASTCRTATGSAAGSCSPSRTPCRRRGSATPRRTGSPGRRRGC